MSLLLLFPGAAAAATAVGSIGTVTVTAPIAAASGAATASATFATVAVSTPLASASGAATAVGSIGTVTVAAPIAAASGTAEPSPQPITSGSIIRPRRKFRPSILFPFEEKPAPKIEPKRTFGAMRAAESGSDSSAAHGSVSVSGRAAVGEIGLDGASMGGRTFWIYREPSPDELRLMSQFLFS